MRNENGSIWRQLVLGQLWLVMEEEPALAGIAVEQVVGDRAVVGVVGGDPASVGVIARGEHEVARMGGEHRCDVVGQRRVDHHVLDPGALEAHDLDARA